MIPVGQPYRAGGRIDARALFSATILGVVTAVVAAAIVWAWELSPIPTLVILTPLAHGFLIGFVLAALIGRLKLRHPKLMWAVGAACGLASVGLIHYAHYLHFLDETGRHFREAQAEAMADEAIDPAKKQEVQAMDANTFANGFLLDQTGHAGFLGSMLFRAQQGFEIKRVRITGVGTWVLWGFETLAVVLVAASLARTRAAAPFCEDCEEWCGKAPSPVQLAGESSHALADAVRADDTHRADELLAQPVDAELLQAAGTRAALHSCGGCDQTFADVETYTVRVKKGKAETLTKPVIKLMRVSPEMTALLRGPQGPDVGPDPDEADLDAEAFEGDVTGTPLDPHRRELHPDGTPLEHRDL